MIESCRSVLNRYIPDIYLYSDVYKGDESGKYVPYQLKYGFVADLLYRSPGYALTLVAESTTSVIHCAEATSQPGISPEDIALNAARSLLSEVEKGGCVDEKHQSLVLIMMVLGSEDVGRCLMSAPTPRTFVRSFTNYRQANFQQNTTLERHP